MGRLARLMKHKCSRSNRTFWRGLLIVEVVICYMSLLNVVSHLYGPPPYQVLTEGSVLSTTDFTTFGGEVNKNDFLPIVNEIQGNVIGYSAQLSLAGTDRVRVEFITDVPPSAAESVLIVDLYNGEAGYDSQEQETLLVVSPGRTEQTVTLYPGETPPLQVQLRIFTDYPVNYTLQGIQVYLEAEQSKVSPAMLVFLSLSLLTTGTTICYYIGYQKRNSCDI